MGTGGINHTIQVYGVFFTPEELKERESWHKTTWLEYEIPEALYKELCEIIDNKVMEFYKKCNCGLCKLNNE